jgi:iron complex transport system ATP-binding protein
MGMTKTMTDTAVTTRGLGYSVGPARLLHDIDLTAARGEVLTVVGQNGAGKSTLLRLLSGEISATAGEVLIDGRNISDYSAPELALKRAVLPQQTVLQFAFKARDVVLMGRSPHLRGTWASLDDEEIAERCMYQTETDRFAPRVYTSLSGGEQSRVNLARVLTQEAPILLLDEPTASLDMRHQELIMRTARQLAAEGACVLAVLHDLNLAAAYSDRIAVLKDGGLVTVGEPDDVLDSELLSDAFDCDLYVMRAPHGGHSLVVPRR